jgi:hypothetical protein
MDNFESIPSDDKLLASPEEWQRYMQSLVWADTKRFLLDRLELVRDDLEKADSWEKVNKLQAESVTIKTMLGLPEYLHEEALQQTTEAQDGQANERSRRGS